jgi:Iap family predicted aminopeptidase
VKANSAGPTAEKFDGLTHQMSQTNALLATLIDRSNQFEESMKERAKKDESMMIKFDDLLNIMKNQAANITQQEIKFARHENILNKLVVPLLDELASALYNMNIEKFGEPRDADFKVKINRLRAQLSNAKENKDF